MDELLVQHSGSVVPFSRGLLSRSLLELGLEPTRAHDIATALHAELLAEKLSLVTTQHLARIVGERLARLADSEVATRYEKMRLLKRSERPLVLLLGGSTGSGKSSLATEIAHRLEVTRILSTDSVRHVMRAMIAERLLPSIHRSSFEAWRTPPVPVSPELEPALAAFRDQVRHVSVAVEAVLERSVQENLSIILEGVHLLPGLFSRFAVDPRIHFLHLVVVVGDEETHRGRFLVRGRGVRDRPSQRYLDNFDTIRAIQAYLVEQADAVGTPVVENRNFDEAIHALLGHVLEGVGDASPIVFGRDR